jgi:hypothetical protein
VRELTSPLAVLREDPAGVLAKWQANGWRWLASLPGLAGLLGVVPLACAAPFLCIDPRLRRVAGVVLVCFAWNALWVGFTDFFLLKYHLPFVPGLVLSAVAVVWRIGERLRERWPATPALQGFACAIAVVAMADWSGAREAFDLVPASLARYDRPHWAEIQRRTGPDAVVVSDQSHAVAWETGRRSVRLHYDRDAEGQLVLGVLSLNDDYLPVDAVYLSRQFLRDPGKRAVLRRTLAELPRFRREFQEVETFPGGGFLFLRRPTPRSPARAAAPASPDRPADPDPR